MSKENFPLPGLVGGVSQQIAALRHPTQCSEQENGLATLIDGLYKRPGSQHISVLALTGPNGASVTGSAGNLLGHVIDRGAAGRYQLVLADGNLMLYSLDSGSVQTVTFPDGLGYLDNTSASQMRCLTIADTTFILNTTVTVTMDTSSSFNATNVAYFHIRVSTPNTTYKLTVDSTTYTAVVPSGGLTMGDLATAIRTGFATALGGGYTVTVIPNTNIVKVTKGSGSITTAKAYDSWDNSGIVSLTNGVDVYSKLPPVFETGYVIQINGTADAAADPYYVKWDGSKYIECVKPGLVTNLTSSTMPHRLVPLSGGTWVFERIDDWALRKAGDDDSVPKPSFVDSTIRNLTFFRNRLMFLTGDSVVLSRPGDYYNFFASSAANVLATDPIDLASPASRVNTLEWAEPFNDDLIIWTDQAQQLRLIGADVLTSETARLVPSTTFITERTVQPIGLGNRAMFAVTEGGYTRLSLYRVSDDTVTNVADDLTEHVQSYIPALPRKLVGSTVSNYVAVLPSGLSKSFKVLRFTIEDEKLTQKAWQNFTLETNDDTRFIDGYWVGSRLYLLTHVTVAGDSPAGGKLHLSYIDFDRLAVDLNAGCSLRLDNRVLATPVAFDGTNTTVDVPYLAAGQLTYVKTVAGVEPQLLTPVASVNLSSSTRATLPGNQMGATIFAGRPFTFRYKFTEFILRDLKGIPLIDAVNTVLKLLFRYVNTGYFKFKVKHRQRATYEYEFNGHTVGLPGQGASELALASGDTHVPIHGKSVGLEVSIESTSVLPVNIPYAEWAVEVNRKSIRR